MESNRPGRPPHSRLAVTAHKANRSGHVVPEAGNKLGDLAKPPFKGIQAGPQRGTVNRRANTRPMPSAALEDRVKASRLPAKSHGQRFQRASAAPTFHGMPLDLPHHGQRHMRTIRKLTLTPAKLTDALADRPSDRSPIFRYAFGHVRTSAFHFQRRE
jgi:hypothetical protein